MSIEFTKPHTCAPNRTLSRIIRNGVEIGAILKFGATRAFDPPKFVLLGKPIAKTGYRSFVMDEEGTLLINLSPTERRAFKKRESDRVRDAFREFSQKSLEDAKTDVKMEKEQDSYIDSFTTFREAKEAAVEHFNEAK